MHVMFSTPQEYFKELLASDQKANSDTKIQDVKADDFFPYADNSRQYWTGFYTSRPGLKYKTRDYGRYLSIARTALGLHAWKHHD